MKKRNFHGALSSWLWIGAAAGGAFALAMASSIYYRHTMENRHREVYESFQKAGIILRERVQTLDHGLQGIAGVYYVANHSPSPAQLHAYAQSRRYFEDFPGVLGFGFIRTVPRLKLPSYEREQRLVNKGFTLHNTPGSEGAPGNHAFIVEAVESLGKDRSVLGLDISSEENRREAAAKSRDSGRPVLTRRIRLAKQSVESAGFLLFHPVFREPIIPASLAERQRQLMGWSYAPVLAEGLLHPFRTMVDSRLFLRVTDVEAKGNELLFTTAAEPAHPGGAVHRLTLDIPVYGRQWRLEGWPAAPLWRAEDSWMLAGIYILLTSFYLITLSGMRHLLQAKNRNAQKVKSLEVWQDAILSAADFAIMATDEKGTITAVNRAAVRILGYSREELVGVANPGIFHDYDELVLRAGELALELGRPVRPGMETFVAKSSFGGVSYGKWSYVRKDQSRFPGRLTLSALRSESGEQRGYLWIVEDQTDLSRAEDDLQRLLIALNRGAIVTVTDEKGMIVEANGNFCALSGYSMPELLGKDWRMLDSGGHTPEFFEGLWNTIREGDLWRGELQHRRKNGSTYWVQTVITPLRASDGKVESYLSIMFDVTERKMAEAKLSQSARLASLGEMAGGIAHEINNPLAMIKGKAAVLLNRLERGEVDEAKLQGDLHKIDATVDRIAAIVTGLRDFSRDSSKETLREESLDKIVEDTLGLCRERFRAHGIELRSTGTKGLLAACRPLQVSQALLNLLNNAHDAVASAPDRWVEVGVEASATRVELSVTDSGRGIAPEIAAKMMQPFFTTKEVGKGTGLGLSISAGLLEAQGGRLYYDAKAERTRFVIEMQPAEKKENGSLKCA